MAPGPPDYSVRWDLDKIGTLDEASFETVVPNITSRIYTICFWFQVTKLAGIKVMANAGNKSAFQKGWSVFLYDNSLIYRANFDSRHSKETTITLRDDGSWQHFSGIVDITNQAIIAYLDGSRVGWHPDKTAQYIEPDSIMADRNLIIGGYTDAAGGHFDHTFGRQGTGLVDDFRIYERALLADEIMDFQSRSKQAPVARFEVTRPDVESPSNFLFDACGAYAEYSQVVINYWEFGDGRFGSDPIVTHSYLYSGAYQVSLTVVNDNYEQDTFTRAVHIQAGEKPILSTPVFVNGTEGYGCYRIPGIVRASNGDLVAFAEGRLKECSDSTPIIRIVCKRSSDNGLSWGPVQVVARNILGGQEYGCMNCSPVVDTIHGKGRIVVVFNKKEFSEWDIARGKGVNRTFCIFSDDHGYSWHGEKDITLSVHKPYNPSYVDIYLDAAHPENKEADWRKQVPLPGHAIQLLGSANNPGIRGRLFFAASYTRGSDSIFDALNYAFWSDDLGQTWQIGNSVPARQDGSSAKGLNETMAVELENGDVLHNCRNYQNGKVVGRRAVAIGSFDEAGNIHFQPAYNDPTLVDSGVQASLIRYTRSDEWQTGGISRLLFANPDHPRARVNMTVRLSYDEGQTWPVSKVVDPGPAAYSDLVIQEDMGIGLLYEQGNQGGIVYTSFTLDWLTDGWDSLNKLESP
jgi:sialidase-1